MMAQHAADLGPEGVSRAIAELHKREAEEERFADLSAAGKVRRFGARGAVRGTRRRGEGRRVGKQRRVLWWWRGGNEARGGMQGEREDWLDDCARAADCTVSHLTPNRPNEHPKPNRPTTNRQPHNQPIELPTAV
jgi:hypothetical protein